MLRHAPGLNVLIYSHDTFGFGHLRRSRAPANAIVQDRPDTSIVIIHDLFRLVLSSRGEGGRLLALGGP